MFKLEIRTAGASFTDNPREVSRLLREVADQVDNAYPSNHTKSIIDSNGNRCGSWKLTTK